MERYWNEISIIHLLTKHYLLIAEELGEEVFLQPLKEHRDAYDHIIRIFGMELRDDQIANPKAYKEDNMKKALGHEYRAFFDTADWLSLVCREKIRLLISNKRPQDIERNLPEYHKIKERLYEIPLEIANLREKKDIGKRGDILSEVDLYKSILDELLDIYHRIHMMV